MKKPSGQRYRMEIREDIFRELQSEPLGGAQLDVNQHYVVAVIAKYPMNLASCVSVFDEMLHHSTLMTRSKLLSANGRRSRGLLRTQPSCGARLSERFGGNIDCCFF